ncbi:MAG: DNA polymerase III subunit epsilon [Rickettsiales bacterium]|nr:DNA polymerase III subunit epsilon [Rickettsiales bacterium]
MRRIALDVETTGLDPYQGHRIIEIGCVELDNNFPTGKTWQRYINPNRSMPQEAYEIHGLTEDFLSDKKPFDEIANEFIEFIGKAELIIHNALFDMKFLNYELELISKDNLENLEVIDTLKMARTLFPGMPSSLDALCRRYKIDLGKRVKHGALLDAELLAEVFLEMQGGRQQGIDLVTLKKENKKENQINIPTKYEKKVYNITEEELSLHKEMIKILYANGKH